MIILENVTKTYSTGVPALNGINLHIQKGEFVFIVGKSGSGKSTLIKLLLKELEPTSGKIYVNKKVLNITLLSGIDKLEKNAKVYTSGLGGDGKCPKGIYIGKAKKLVTQSDGTTMTLTVKTAAQFKDLSYVSVVKKVNGNEE